MPRHHRPLLVAALLVGTAVAPAVPVVSTASAASPVAAAAAASAAPFAGGDGRGPATDIAMKPLDLAVDGATTYVVDSEAGIGPFTGPLGRTLLRVVRPDGNSSPLAVGDLACGSACPKTITGVAVSPSGQVYVSDRWGKRIFRWSSATGFTHVAGNGTYGTSGDGGPATSAGLALDAFGAPDALAVDPQGRLVFGDTASVRRIELDGTVTRVAGADADTPWAGPRVDVPATSFPIRAADLAFSPDGELLVAEGSWVRRVDAGGVLRRVAGDGWSGTNGDGGPAVDARLLETYSIAFGRDGALYVASYGGIRKVDRSGIISTFADHSTAMRIDDGRGSLAGVADGLLMTHVARSGPALNDFRVFRLAYDASALTVYAGNGHTRFSGDGRPATDAQLDRPRRVATSTDGTTVVHDAGNRRVRRISRDGIITTVAGGGQLPPAQGLSAAQLDLPDGDSSSQGLDGLALGADGTLYLAFPGTGKVWSVDPISSALRLVAGSGARARDGGNVPSGPAVDAALTAPSGLAVLDDERLLLIAHADGVAVVDLDDGSLSPLSGGGDIRTLDGAGQPAWAVDVRSGYGNPDVEVDDLGRVLAVGYDSAYRVTGCGSYSPLWRPSGAEPGVSDSVVVGGSTIALAGGRPHLLGSRLVPLDVPGRGDFGAALPSDGLVLSDRATGLLTRTTVPPAPANPRSPTADCTEGEYHPLTPSRLLDTRSALGGHDRPFTHNETFSLDVTGVGGVPVDGVTAVVLNVTATEPSTAGHLSVYPGSEAPTTSNLNVVRGQTVANLVTTAVGPDGNVTVKAAAGSTHVVVDVAGWFSDGTVAGGARFNPVTPARMLDTRDGTGGPRLSLGPGQSRALTVTGRGGVPATGARSVLLNVTVTEPTSSGNVVVWPNGRPRPTASNVNFVPGEDVPNLVSVAVGDGGQVMFGNAGGTTHLVADVVGWYGAGGPTAGRMHAVQPYRLYDSRQDGAPWGPRDAYELDALAPGAGGEIRVPSDGVAAVVLNVTATDPTTATNVTVWPAGLPRPGTSNLNVVAGETAPNQVVVRVGECEGGGTSCIAVYNNAGDTDLIFDVVGWYEDDGVLVAPAARMQPGPGQLRRQTLD